MRKNNWENFNLFLFEFIIISNSQSKLERIVKLKLDENYTLKRLSVRANVKNQMINVQRDHYNIINICTVQLFVTDLLLLKQFVPLQHLFGGLAWSGRLWLRRLARSCLALEAFLDIAFIHVLMPDRLPIGATLLGYLSFPPSRTRLVYNAGSCHWCK